MDKIVSIKEERGTMFVVLKNGTKVPVKATTTETYWESGRKDCKINIEEPLNGTSEQLN